MWTEGPKTDRAIELLRVCGAKTDADGHVVPTYRYSRSFKHVAPQLQDLGWGAQSETVIIERSRSSVHISIYVTNADGTAWEQEGKAGSSDTCYDWYALAACRAILNFTTDDGDLMSEDEVIAMLEQQRQRVMDSAEQSRKQG